MADNYKLDFTGEEVDRLLEKIDNLIFDDAPTANSENGVSSQGVKTYVDTQVATKQNKMVGYSTTIVTTDWLQKEDGSYFLFIPVTGVKDSDSIFFVAPKWEQNNLFIRLNQQQAWNCVSMITTGNDYIQVICDKTKPVYEVPIYIRVIRN